MASEAYQPKVLQDILGRVKRSRQLIPVVIFDLDDTLFYVAPRTKRIFKDFFTQAQNAATFPREGEALGRMPWQEFCHSWKDTLTKAGISAKDGFAESFAVFWRQRNMHDSYIAFDTPIPGARDYVTSLHRAGAKIVYLTARPHPLAAKGTREALQRSGFPLPDSRDPRSPIVLMRNLPGSSQKEPASDPDFKRLMAKSLVTPRHTVVATFENEPGNLNAMVEVLPGAVGVFIDTRHSHKHGLPKSGLPWVAHYLN